LAVTFFLLFVASLVAIIIGLINPQTVIRWGANRTRKVSSLTYGAVTIVCLVVFVVSIPNQPTRATQPPPIVATGNTAATSKTESLSNNTSNQSSTTVPSPDNVPTTATSPSKTTNTSTNPTSNKTTKTNVTTSETVASKSTSSLARSNPLAGVYHPYRLHVIDALKTVSGTVEIVRHEPDHDYHINLKLDPKYSSLVDSKNVKYEHGVLVVEVILMDQHDVPIPTVGQHVTVTGSYVEDADHGWMEIHPAWFINGKGSPAYTTAAAAASVQMGLKGNGDEGIGLTTGTSVPPSSQGTSTSSSSGLTLVSFTSNVTRGSYASITVHGVPGTTASMEGDYSSGQSNA